MGEEGGTHYINISTPTSLHQYNDEIHAGKFGIIGGPLELGKTASEFFSPEEEVTRSAKPCCLGGHLVKTKILTEAHCSLFKIDLACGDKN